MVQPSGPLTVMGKIFKIAVAVVAASCWPLASFSQDAPPSLSETLAWMEKTFNPDEGRLRYGEYAEYSQGKIWLRKTETFGYMGCKMTLHEEDDSRAAFPGSWHTSRNYSFNLHDIDPTTFEISTHNSKYGGIPCTTNIPGMTCDMEQIFFKTTDKNLLIDEKITTISNGTQANNHKKYGTNKTFRGDFYLNNLEYADRFAKAFRHAIALCGGKPSPF